MTRDLKILSFSLLTWGIGESLFIYTQTLYMESLGANALTIGTILAIASFAMTLSHIPAGALADRMGSKRILLFNWVFSLVAAALMYFAQGLAVFTVGLVLYQFTGFVLSPLSAYITSARGTWTSAHALTATYAMFSIGGFIGSMIGWLLGNSLTLHAGYGLALIVFIFSTASVFLLQDIPVEVQHMTGDIKELRERSRFNRFLLLSGLILFAAYFSWPFTPNYLQEIRAVSTDTIRLFGALNALGMAVLSLIVGKFESQRALILAQMLVGASAGLLWLGRSQPLYAAGYFLAGGFRAIRSLLMAQVESMVKPGNRGLAFGILETLSGITLTLSPAAAGFLYQISPSLPYPVSLFLIGAGLIISVSLMRKSGHKPQSARPANM